MRVAEPGELDRLWALARVVRREAEYLAQTDWRLFGQVFDAERARTLPLTPELAERVDAFVARFGCLQDTLADKLLPAHGWSPQGDGAVARCAGLLRTGGCVAEAGRVEARRSLQNPNSRTSTAEAWRM